MMSGTPRYAHTYQALLNKRIIFTVLFMYLPIYLPI